MAQDRQIKVQNRNLDKRHLVRKNSTTRYDFLWNVEKKPFRGLAGPDDVAMIVLRYRYIKKHITYRSVEKICFIFVFTIWLQQKILLRIYFGYIDMQMTCYLHSLCLQEPQYLWYYTFPSFIDTSRNILLSLWERELLTFGGFIGDVYQIYISIFLLFCKIRIGSESNYNRL